MGIVVSKKMLNLVVFMEPTVEAHRTHLNGGNMILNRFCIDEVAAFELSGVNFLKPRKMSNRKVKGKERSFLQSYITLRNLLVTGN